MQKPVRIINFPHNEINKQEEKEWEQYTALPCSYDDAEGVHGAHLNTAAGDTIEALKMLLYHDMMPYCLVMYQSDGQWT